MDELKNTQTMQDTHKNAKSKKLFAIRLAFVIISAVLFIILFIVIICLKNKISSLSRRLEASEEYIAAENRHIYTYAEPGDMITINDPTYGEIWIKPHENVPLNSHDYTNLKLENSRYNYYENGEKVSITGIDVSYHQGDIDWKLVAEDGIEFAMIRLGYRGYETGLINEDALAKEYIDGALNAGLDIGAYFYSQAITEQEAIEEAQFVIKMLEGKKVTYPVVFDWELPEDPNARTRDISPEMLNKCAVAFCNEISAAGYTPMIYANLRMALFKYDMSALYQHDFWYVEYKHGYNPPLYPYELQMWQYASDGRVNGIDHDVDLNICFVDYAQKYELLHTE